MTTHHEPELTNRRRRWVVPTVALIILALGACCCVTPALLSGMPIRPEVVQRALVPGGEYEVVVSKRYAWGLNEFIDPAMVVYVELRRGEKLVGSERLELVEDSDWEEAHVFLEGTAVVVTGLDERTPRRLRFDLPRP